jgi:hypothetical protein
MTGISPRTDFLPSRLFAKPWLLDHHFIDTYIDSFGLPECYCCHELTNTFLPGVYRAEVRIYCLNCAMTLTHVGVCVHN